YYSLNYTLLVTDCIHWMNAEEGYNIICFILRVASENDLRIFIEQMSGKLGILLWQPSTEEEYLRGTNPLESIGLPSIGDDFTHFYIMGRDNQDLREMYANGFRLVKPGDYELPWRDKK